MRFPLLLLTAGLLAGSPAVAQLPDYHRADSLALAVPRSAAGSVDSIARYLSQGLTTDEERARAVFRWVTENIDYDTRSFFGNRMNVPMQTPEQVLRRRTAVCDGYSALVAAIGQAMGLEVVVVPGQAKGWNGDYRNAPRRGGHAWNAVRINGQWRLIDTTWGAGDLIGRSFVRQVRDFFFFADPEKLIFSHFPRDPQWQLLSAPLSQGQWVAQVAPARDFWELGWEVAAVRSAGRELVGSFPVPGHAIRVREAPAVGRLSEGTPVRLALEAPGASEVFAITGDRWLPLSSADGVFRGDAAMGADKLVVMVRYPGRPDGAVVLEWLARH
jgi:transglutaminase-like putative cysteine protease